MSIFKDILYREITSNQIRASQTRNIVGSKYLIERYEKQFLLEGIIIAVIVAIMIRNIIAHFIKDMMVALTVCYSPKMEGILSILVSFSFTISEWLHSKSL